MPDLLQKVSNNNSVKIAAAAPASAKPDTAPAENKAVETTQKTNNNYFNNKTILGSLLGLATIGGSIWAVKSGKFKSKSNSISLTPEQINAKIIDVVDEMNQLKNLIKYDYTIKREHIIEKFFNTNDTAESLRFRDGNELSLKIAESRKTYDKVMQTAGLKISEQKQIIKDKFTKLLQDPEFNNLRKLRKSLVQIKKNAQTDDELNIANEKIAIINNLLLHKVYPEDSDKFIQLYNADFNKLMELVNGKYENYEHYISKYKELNPVPTEFNFESVEHSFFHSDDLRFEDVFPKESEIVKNNMTLIKESGENCQIFEKLRKNYIEKLTELASKYTDSEAIRDLKNLGNQLKSLRKQLKSLTSGN